MTMSNFLFFAHQKPANELFEANIWGLCSEVLKDNNRMRPRRKTALCCACCAGCCCCCLGGCLCCRLLLAGGPTHSVPRQLQAQLLCAGGPAMLLQLRLCLRPDQLRQRIYLRV